MATDPNLVSTYNRVGIREDLTDRIYDISPTDNPVTRAIGRDSASNRKHEWQTDELKPAATNAAIEGDDASYEERPATVRPFNQTQIMTKTVIVSDTAEAVDMAGRDSEIAYQLSKSTKEISRDVEYAITRNQAMTAGTSASAATLGSLESWISTNSTHTGDSGTTPGFSSGSLPAPTDGTQAGSFTEALLKSVVADCWTEGGFPTMINVGPVNKQKASGFSGIATLYRDTAPSLDQASIIGGADVYVSDFGQHNIVANRFSRDRTALFLDPEYASIAYLRPLQQKVMAKTGDNEKRLMTAELTLVVKNEKAHGKAADLQTT